MLFTELTFRHKKSDGCFKRFTFQMSDFHFVNIKALLDRRLAADLQWQLQMIARTKRSKRHQKKHVSFHFFIFSKQFQRLLSRYTNMCHRQFHN